MTDTPTLIAEAMHKLADAFERQGSCITARTIREAFPLPESGKWSLADVGVTPQGFVDDGPNGLGGVISPDDVEPAAAAPLPDPGSQNGFTDRNGNAVKVGDRVTYFGRVGIVRSIAHDGCADVQFPDGTYEDVNWYKLFKDTRPKPEPAPETPDDLVERLKYMASQSETSHLSQLFWAAAAEIARLNERVTCLVEIKEILTDAVRERDAAQAEFVHPTAPVTDEEVQKILATMQYAPTARDLIERLARREREAQEEYDRCCDELEQLIPKNKANRARAESAERRLAAAVRALEIIAGEAQCLDNLMGDKDIARDALSSLKGNGG